MIMEYLISTLLPASAEHSVVNILAQSDFALESFGNAKTINNPNSSRFVKFLNLAIVEPPRPKKPKSARLWRRGTKNYDRLMPQLLVAVKEYGTKWALIYENCPTFTLFDAKFEDLEYNYYYYRKMAAAP